MSAYPYPTHYNDGNVQPRGIYDPSQYGGFNSQATHDTLEPSGYQEHESEPYKDEPAYSLPQGQSTEPLGLSTKEEAPYFPDEFVPTPRKPVWVHRCPASFRLTDDLVR